MSDFKTVTGGNHYLTDRTENHTDSLNSCCPFPRFYRSQHFLFPGPINFSTVSGSEVTGGEQEPDDYTESLFPITEDSGPRYVESSLLRGQGDTSGDRVNFGE